MRIGVVVLAVFCAFVAGALMMRAGLQLDGWSFIAAGGLVAIVMGLVGVYDTAEAPA